MTVREADASTVDASLGAFELVTIGRALHWLGGDSYLERLEPLTGQVALLGDRISDSEAFSTVLAVAEELTGGRPQAPGMLVGYESALRRSAFSEITNLSVEDERTWTRDSLVGWAFSTSFASQERLGARRDEFERELRSRLRPRYVERVPVDALLGRRPELARPGELRSAPGTSCSTERRTNDRSSAAATSPTQPGSRS